MREAKPGQAFSVLKRLGAQPGDCTDGGTFTLPEHESKNLTAQQSAECMAEHFASISSSFPPLNENLLRLRVKAKLQSVEEPPIVSDYDTYCKIMASKKPRS